MEAGFIQKRITKKFIAFVCPSIVSLAIFPQNQLTKNIDNRMKHAIIHHKFLKVRYGKNSPTILPIKPLEIKPKSLYLKKYGVIQNPCISCNWGTYTIKYTTKITPTNILILFLFIFIASSSYNTLA